jgi:hypothetical protein
VAKTREGHLVSRPHGGPATENFRLVEVDLAAVGQGEHAIRNTYVSVDPHMRGRMNANSRFRRKGAVVEGRARFRRGVQLPRRHRERSASSTVRFRRLLRQRQWCPPRSGHRVHLGLREDGPLRSHSGQRPVAGPSNMALVVTRRLTLRGSSSVTTEKPRPSSTVAFLSGLPTATSATARPSSSALTELSRRSSCCTAERTSGRCSCGCERTGPLVARSVFPPP